MNVLVKVKTTSPAKAWTSSPMKDTEDSNPDGDLNTTQPVTPSGTPMKDFNIDKTLNNIFSTEKVTKINEENDGNGDRSPKNSDSGGDNDFSGDDSSIDSTSKIVDENLSLRASCKVSEQARLKLFQENQEKDEKIEQMEAEIALLKEQSQRKTDEIKALKTEKLKQEERSLKDPGEVASLKEDNKTLTNLVEAAGNLLQSGFIFIS